MALSTTRYLLPRITLLGSAKVLGTTVVAVLFWEHIGRKYATNWRPSVGITAAADLSQKVFQWTGERWAWFTSYLTAVDLKEIGVTINDVAKPSIDLFWSWTYAFSGYFAKAASYTNKSWLVYTGSFLTTGALLFGYYWLSCRYPVLNFYTPLLHFLGLRKP